MQTTQDCSVSVGHTHIAYPVALLYSTPTHKRNGGVCFGEQKGVEICQRNGAKCYTKSTHTSFIRTRVGRGGK